MTDIERAKELAARGAHLMTWDKVSEMPKLYKGHCDQCGLETEPQAASATTRDILRHARETLPDEEEVTAPISPIIVSASGGESLAEASRRAAEHVGAATLDEEHRKLIPKKERFKAYVPRPMDGTTDYAILKRAALEGRNALLMSDAGAGKNHLCEAVAADLEIPMICISFNTDIQTEDLIGGMTFAGGDTRWVDGFFTDFFRLATMGQRCMVVFDELNSATHGVVFRLHMPLDERRTLSLAEKPGRETLKDEEKNLIVVGTMNPDYRGTKPLNQALKRRFKIKLTLDYDRKVEEKLLYEKGVNPDYARKLLNLAGGLRKSYHDTDLGQPLGTADLLDYADNTRLFGESIARHSLLQNYDADERQAVYQAIQLHIDQATSTVRDVDEEAPF